MAVMPCADDIPDADHNDAHGNYSYMIILMIVRMIVPRFVFASVAGRLLPQLNLQVRMV